MFSNAFPQHPQQTSLRIERRESNISTPESELKNTRVTMAIKYASKWFNNVPKRKKSYCSKLFSVHCRLNIKKRNMLSSTKGWNREEWASHLSKTRTEHCRQQLNLQSIRTITVSCIKHEPRTGNARTTTMMMGPIRRESQYSPSHRSKWLR